MLTQVDDKCCSDSNSECPDLKEREDYDNDSLVESHNKECQLFNNEERIHKNRKELLNSDKANDLDFKCDLALDTGATFASIRIKDIVTNIRDSKNPILMCANAGERRLDKVGEILGMNDEA